MAIHVHFRSLACSTCNLLSFSRSLSFRLSVRFSACMQVESFGSEEIPELTLEVFCPKVSQSRHIYLVLFFLPAAKKGVAACVKQMLLCRRLQPYHQIAVRDAARLLEFIMRSCRVKCANKIGKCEDAILRALGGHLHRLCVNHNLQTGSNATFKDSHEFSSNIINTSHKTRRSKNNTGYRRILYKF